MKWIALGLIRFYQLTLSRLTPSSCRFVPTCSQYGYEAIGKFGIWKGGWLTVRRISRCHPWSKGGLDPVPCHEGRGLHKNSNDE